MAYAIAHTVKILHQGPNPVLNWDASFDEYRIPISYGGYWSTLIKYCPFCGSKLPDSKQELWYQTLYGMGYTDPGEQEIPKAFNTDQWWRQRE